MRFFLLAAMVAGASDAFAQGGYRSGPFCPAGLGFGGPGFSIFWVALLIIFGIAAFKLIKSTHSSRETPKDILKRRYASGEISHDDYERMKKEL